MNFGCHVLWNLESFKIGLHFIKIQKNGRNLVDKALVRLHVVDVSWDENIHDCEIHHPYNIQIVVVAYLTAYLRALNHNAIGLN
jgi:hypothetical protein